jgi:type 2 lantibiotic biosynthesis protein LanM
MEEATWAGMGERHSIAAVDSLEARISSWRSQPPLDVDDWFRRRLAADRFTARDWNRVLSEPIEVVRERTYRLPRWLNEVDEALKYRFDSILDFAQMKDGQEVFKFLVAIESFISRFAVRLRAGIDSLASKWTILPFDPATASDILFVNLPASLLKLLDRTLVLEMNAAGLQGMLSGATPSERFDSFIARLRDVNYVTALLCEYPVLARQVAVRLEQWVQFSLEFLRHLCEDWHAICAKFSPHDRPGKLVALREVGDRHRLGRSVLIARFEGGMEVVYKPRSLSIDIHFQQLLRWFNARSEMAPFRTLELLDRASHGWVEFVSPRASAVEGDVRRFYERLGGMLAVLHVLHATDVHFENLIAAGDQPVLVDLETLFHSYPTTALGTEGDPAPDAGILGSVMRVGLLPHRLWADEEYKGVELSGLGGEAGQLGPKAAPCIESGVLDQMRIVRKRLPILGGRNRPTLGGRPVNVADYAEPLLDGFEYYYRLIQSHRDELLAAEGPISSFSRDEVRVIVRPTQCYAMMLQESFHPDFLRDALERDRFFDRLWFGVPQSPALARIVSAEQEDLWQGDIPLLRSRPCSRDLWTSNRTRVPQFLTHSGMDLVRRRILQLSEPDLDLQKQTVRESLQVLTQQ